MGEVGSAFNHNRRGTDGVHADQAHDNLAQRMQTLAPITPLQLQPPMLCSASAIRIVWFREALHRL